MFLWGPPGIGKSELVKQIGDSGALGKTHVIDMRLALFEPTDLSGYPVPNMETGVMQWLPPADLPSEELAAQYGGGAALRDVPAFAPAALGHAAG